MRAQVDGDGHADLVYFSYVRQRYYWGAELGVCLADGTDDKLPSPGMGEVFFLADVDKDDVEEMFFGGNSASENFVRIARMVDGDLRQIRKPGGNKLTLRDGLEAPRSWFAFGCIDPDRSDKRSLVQLRLVKQHHRFEWTKRFYSLDGDTATPGCREVRFGGSQAGRVCVRENRKSRLGLPWPKSMI